MGDRVTEALEVARRISRYGGSVVVLIHPNILDHKLSFEKEFVAGVRPYAWFGSVGEFGRWWAARDHVQLDVAQDARTLIVAIAAHELADGLTLEIPAGWTLSPTRSSLKGIQQRSASVILPEWQGAHRLACTSSRSSK